MNQNNLLDVVNFMKENKTFSDYNFVNDFMSSLNFTKYRFKNNINKDNINNKELYNNKQLIGGYGSDDSSQIIPPTDGSLQTVQPIDGSLQTVQSIDGSLQTVQPINSSVQMIQPIDGSVQMIQPIDGSVQTIQPADGSAQMISSTSQQFSISQDVIPEVGELNEEINKFGNSGLTIGVNDDMDCIYKKIKNPDGTYITQKICDQKIVTMPDMFLPKPTFMYSGTNTYIIKKGTILYHATVQKRGFNTSEIRLGKDKLISFFTPNFRLASDKIEGCSIDKQKGFIHVFEVKTDIVDIFIKLPYDTDEDLNLDELKDKFCNGNEYYKGVGFFYPKNEIELFNNSIFNQRTEEMHENLDDDSYYSEFALCSPNDYLTYLYSQKCMSLRKLSQPYRFDGKNYN